MSGRLFDPRRKDGTYPFVYVCAAATDVRKTIERARIEQAAQKEKDERAVPRLITRRRT